MSVPNNRDTEKNIQDDDRVNDDNKDQESQASSSAGGTPSVTSIASGITRSHQFVQYKDRSDVIIDSLTDSDKKILRLYEDNAVIGGPFPVKLQIILKVTELLGQQHIISWLPHGRSFMIHRPREFEEKIMGEFFKQTKLSSFKRQLNLYDFQRVTRGTDCGSYYHEMFLRGKPLLAKRMVRRKIKGTKNQPTTSSSSNEDERVPDFYSMPFVDGNKNMLNLHQSNRLAMMKRATLMGGGGPQDHMYGGMGVGGGVADHQLSSSLSRLHGTGAVGGPPNSINHGIGGPSGAGMHMGGLPPALSQNQGMSSYDALLNHQSGLPPQSSLLQHGEISPNALIQLQLQQQLQQQQQVQQQQQLPPQHMAPQHDFMLSEAGGPQQMHNMNLSNQMNNNSYVAAMENLNNSYALAATALKRNNMNTNPLLGHDDLVAAKQYNNRQAASGPNPLNYYSQGW
jgi:hypothetical protein